MRRMAGPRGIVGEKRLVGSGVRRRADTRRVKAGIPQTLTRERTLIARTFFLIPLLDIKRQTSVAALAAVALAPTACFASPGRSILIMG